MKTILPYILTLFFSAHCIGCSDNAVDVDPKPEPEVPEDTISGIYAMSGQQINMDVCYGPSINCDFRDILSRDTIQTSFEMQIDVVESKEDTVWLTGLEGVDVSIQNADFTGRAAFAECQIDRDCPYAKISGEAIEFDLTYWQYKYYGSGTLVDGKLSFNTHYRYRGDGVEYILEGEKVEKNEINQ